MNILKQSTAATVKLGAFVDDSDGKTAETGLTISQADIRLSKNGGDFAQTNNATGATHDEFGYYDIPLDTTDTNTLGRLRVAVSESGALPVWQDFLVVTANVYDTLCSTDSLDVNAATIAPDAITALATGVWTDTEVYGAAEKGFLLQTLFDDLVNGGRLDLLIDSIIAHLVGIKGTGWTNQTLKSIGTSVVSIVEAVDLIDDDLVDGGRLDLLIDAIKAKTDLIPAAPAQAGEYTAAIAAVQADLDNPDQYKADVSALATTAHVQEVEDKVDIVDGIADAILEDTGTTLDTNITAILADTNELQTDLVNGGRLDLLIDSIIAHLVGIKGTGWTNQTLKSIGTSVVSIVEAVDLIDDDLVDGGRLDLLIDSIIAHLVGIKGTGWTNQTLAKIDTDIAAISAGSGATAQEVWEYADRALTESPTDISTLATTAHLQEVEDKVDGVKTQTDKIPASPAAVGSAMTLQDGAITAAKIASNAISAAKIAPDAVTEIQSGLATSSALATVDGIVDAIKLKTDLIPATPAQAGEYTAAIAAIPTAPLLAANYTAPDNTSIAAIKEKTDNLPADPADDSDIDAQLAAIKAETALIVEDTGTTIPATLAGLALEATLTAMKGTGWTNQTLKSIGTSVVSIVEAVDLIDDDLVDGGRLDLLIDAIKAKTDNLPADPADDSDIDAQLAAIKAETALIVEDTGTTIPATLAGLALEATLTAMKGTGWTDETLVALMTAIEAVTGGSGATAQEVWEYATRTLTAGTNIDLSSLATAADLQDVEDKIDVIATDTTTEIPATLATLATSAALATVDTNVDSVLADTNEIQAELADGGRTDLLIDAIKANTDLIPATPAQAGEYTAAIAAVKSVADDILEDTGTTLDTLIKDIPTNTELATALGTADDAVLAAVAAAKAVIDNIHDTDLPAVKAETALIVEDTGTTLPATLATLAGYTDGIAGDVWSYAKRTLTHPSVSAEEPEDSNTLILYRDADIAIELTDLTIPAGAKKYIFTIKDNLDSGDDQAVLQASYAIDGSEVETNTLVYINSAAAPVLTNPVTFTLTDTNITIDLTAEAAALLPRYERGYLNWDLKLVTDAAVTIVLQGLAQIIGTSTRAIE